MYGHGFDRKYELDLQEVSLILIKRTGSNKRVSFRKKKRTVSSNIRFIVSARVEQPSLATPRGGEGLKEDEKAVIGWEGREGKEGRERSRWRRLSIDGRLNNSKASCPAIFKRRAPTCACGRNPWSNSASPNKCILLMEGEEGRETLLRLESYISSSRLTQE